MSCAPIVLVCFAGLARPPVVPAADTAPEFEVASIRPSAPGGRHGVWTNGSHSHIQMLGMNLKDLMSFAYDVEGYRVSGQGPIVSGRYDVLAKITDDAANLPDKERWIQIHLMTQRLLADRFKLTFHRSTVEISVYRLVIWKSGSKIRELGPDPGDNVLIDRRPGHLSAKQMPMKQLVTILTRELRWPVLDATGIRGVFDITLDWAPESTVVNPARANQQPENLGDAPDAKPSLFTAVEQQLGLKLEPGKSAIEILVIDQAERASEN
jgi:uncharacterized protein (TIGR03435 family)